MPIHPALPKLYLVRHGETAWTLSGQHTGRTDMALTGQGEREARSVRPLLENVDFGLVLSSPLQRARRTAELAGFGAVAQLDPDLSEWDYGSCEGRSTADIRTEHPGWHLFEDGCPGGETLNQVRRRAERVIGRARALEADTLIFAHRDILRILIARWLGLPAREARYFYLATASLSILGYDHNLDEPVIRLLNEAHR
ncbi:MAG TPA: histidine phosphatase family protein [Burkholderiales bacterium]|nr:histidine phosphatase family protein [Burkholderiales bacterium]